MTMECFGDDEPINSFLNLMPVQDEDLGILVDLLVYISEKENHETARQQYIAKVNQLEQQGYDIFNLRGDLEMVERYRGCQP